MEEDCISLLILYFNAPLHFACSRKRTKVFLGTTEKAPGIYTPYFAKPSQGVFSVWPKKSFRGFLQCLQWGGAWHCWTVGRGCRLLHGVIFEKIDDTRNVDCLFAATPRRKKVSVLNRVSSLPPNVFEENHAACVYFAAPLPACWRVSFLASYFNCFVFRLALSLVGRLPRKREINRGRSIG